MKRIAFFCIPAHGHTNPMLPIATELVSRGNKVRFYSFNEFKEKIETTGAEFVSCDSYLPALNSHEENAITKVSTTEMTLQDIRITLAMNDFLHAEFISFKPHIVYTDSVCFWGKLNAYKHNVPMVVSTSTFAFNQMSSQYMKNSPKELVDIIIGLPKISKEIKKLEPYGYHVHGVLSLVQSDNMTDSIVYTSRHFQPYVESFSKHYAFIGPSVYSNIEPNKEKCRPLVYVSLGTVINNRPDFYRACILALEGLDVDAIISCGNAIKREYFGSVPENIKIYPYVNQLEVLSRADVFITHCGMNSVSESLYMATPMVLYPQTNEQRAVAKRVREIGAGIGLVNDTAKIIRSAVQKILNNEIYMLAAKKCSVDFRSCSGVKGGADFLESAPHFFADIDPLAELNKVNRKFKLLYGVIELIMIVLFGLFIGWKYVWIIGVSMGIFSIPISKLVQKKQYSSIIESRTNSKH